MVIFKTHFHTQQKSTDTQITKLPTTLSPTCKFTSKRYQIPTLQAHITEDFFNWREMYESRLEFWSVQSYQKFSDVDFIRICIIPFEFF